MITIDMRFIKSSGIGTYISYLVPGIIAKMQFHEFTLLGNSRDIFNIGITPSARVRIIEASSKMYSLSEQFELPRLIPANTSLFFSPHYPVPLFYRGKLLVTIHDVFHLAMPKLVGGLHKLMYAKLMFWQACKKASTIIVDSAFTKSELEHYVPGILPPIHTIHLGVDSSWFSTSKLDDIHLKPYFVFVGNIKPNKNLVSLVQAYISILHKIPHDLIIIGKKSGFMTADSRVYQLAAQYPDRIFFTDFLPDQELRDYMKGASALVFPSLYEGFGLPPLEAMACGCPVIVSHSASLPEICSDAVLYCDPNSIENIANMMELIARDTTLQDDLRIKGLHHARKFEWSQCVDQTVCVIEDLLK